MFWLHWCFDLSNFLCIFSKINKNDENGNSNEVVRTSIADQFYENSDDNETASSSNNMSSSNNIDREITSPKKMKLDTTTVLKTQTDENVEVVIPSTASETSKRRKRRKRALFSVRIRKNRKRTKNTKRPLMVVPEEAATTNNLTANTLPAPTQRTSIITQPKASEVPLRRSNRINSAGL